MQIAGMQLILEHFQGRTRWPRTKLKEIMKANHGESLVGLYRATETRFAGKYLELQRAFKLKSDLRRVVVSAQFEQKGYGSCSQDVESTEADGASGDVEARAPAAAGEVDDMEVERVVAHILLPSL